MINWIHSQIHRPHHGWDPVPADHALEYAEYAWRNLNEEIVDQLNPWLGNFAGKRVLDLGGGPGQFSVAMARRGAEVVWHDVSKRYLLFAQQKAQDFGVTVQFNLGYLEDAISLGENSFDLVFNRGCWFYARSDKAFAPMIWHLLKPGGVGYIDTPIAGFQRELLPLSFRVRTALNARLGLKIGHPFPPHRRIVRLVHNLPLEKLYADYSCPTYDRVIFVKARC